MAMRVLAALLVASLFFPFASAEFGAESNGYPVGEGGLLHDPEVAFEPEALLALQERFAQDYPALNKVGPATAYPYYPILEAEIQRLALDHPDKVKVQYGTSTGRLGIYFLEIANFGDQGTRDFVPIDEREVVMIDGGTHSNEYSGVYFVLALAQWLLDESPEDEFAQWILENRYTIITPMVNPDGSNAMGRLNAKGVNINRNFPVLWGGDGTDMLLNNPGPSAMSEVETKLIVDRVMHYQPDYHASIHCCGNLWLFPYGEDGYDPLDVDMMNHICDVAYPADIRNSCGPIWSTIYPASGSTVDTVYEYTGAVAFGFEMSGRSNLAGPWGEPVTVAEVEAQEQESWDAVMHAFRNVHLYGGYPFIENINIGVDSTTITLRNLGYGPLNATLSGGEMGDMVVEMLEPNGTVTMTMPGQLKQPGISTYSTLTMDYQKRIMASPSETLTFTVDKDSDDFITLDGKPIGLLDASVYAAEDAAAPGLPLVLLLVALVILARRR